MVRNAVIIEQAEVGGWSVARRRVKDEYGTSLHHRGPAEVDVTSGRIS